MLKSGVHATLAGVLLAFFIPLRANNDTEAPLRRLEHDLHPAVAFGILPLFAFVNTGISFEGLTLSSLFASVPLGIAAGLFVGNQIGIFLFTWIAIKLGIGKLPSNVGWLDMYGLAVLCGIGFTMSLFISSLAFEQGGAAEYAADDRLGILVGSFLSALIGYAILRYSLTRRPAANNHVQMDLT